MTSSLIPTFFARVRTELVADWSFIRESASSAAQRMGWGVDKLFNSLTESLRLRKPNVPIILINSVFLKEDLLASSANLKRDLSMKSICLNRLRNEQIKNI